MPYKLTVKNLKQTIGKRFVRYKNLSIQLIFKFLFYFIKIIMEPQTDMLTEIHEEINLEPVSTGIRFADYIVDIIAFYLTAIVVGVIAGTLSINYTSDTLFLYFISYAIFIGYYTIMEGASNGRTLGKLITGSRAVKDDGSNITWKDALLRSLSRSVPFEPFSAFGGYPWHDRWTNTKVVKNKRKFD